MTQPTCQHKRLKRVDFQWMPNPWDVEEGAHLQCQDCNATFPTGDDNEEAALEIYLEYFDATYPEATR